MALEQWYVPRGVKQYIKVTRSDVATLRRIEKSTHSNRKRWKFSQNQEIQAFDDLNTWEPDNYLKRQSFSTHMIHKIRINTDRTVHRFSSDTVARGDHQIFSE